MHVPHVPVRPTRKNPEDAIYVQELDNSFKKFYSKVSASLGTSMYQHFAIAKCKYLEIFNAELDSVPI